MTEALQCILAQCETVRVPKVPVGGAVSCDQSQDVCIEHEGCRHLAVLGFAQDELLQFGIGGHRDAHRFTFTASARRALVEQARDDGDDEARAATAEDGRVQQTDDDGQATAGKQSPEMLPDLNAHVILANHQKPSDHGEQGECATAHTEPRRAIARIDIATESARNHTTDEQQNAEPNHARADPTGQRELL